MYSLVNLPKRNDLLGLFKLGPLTKTVKVDTLLNGTRIYPDSFYGSYFIRIVHSKSFYEASVMKYYENEGCYYVENKEHVPSQLNIDELYGYEFYISYFNRGCGSRPFHPAITYYNKNGLVIGEKYSLHGNMHNIAGPAFRYFDEEKKCWHNKFFINGKSITLDEFCALQERRYNERTN